MNKNITTSLLSFLLIGGLYLFSSIPPKNIPIDPLRQNSNKVHPAKVATHGKAASSTSQKSSNYPQKNKTQKSILLIDKIYGWFWDGIKMMIISIMIITVMIIIMIIIIPIKLVYDDMCKRRALELKTNKFDKRKNEQIQNLKESKLWDLDLETYDNSAVAGIICEYVDFDEEYILRYRMAIIQIWLAKESTMITKTCFASLLRQERKVIRLKAWLKDCHQWQEAYKQYSISANDMAITQVFLNNKKEEYKKDLAEKEQTIKNVRYVPYISYAFAWVLVQWTEVLEKRFATFRM